MPGLLTGDSFVQLNLRKCLSMSSDQKGASANSQAIVALNTKLAPREDREIVFYDQLIAKCDVSDVLNVP